MIDFLFDFVNFFGASGDAYSMPAPVLAFVQLALWCFIGTVILFSFRLVLSLIRGW